ncbi:MAG: hypothetical protein IJD10_03000 [Clostridia bacterium]|nr:hypothetical protein [Clostridia bacterium]
MFLFLNNASCGGYTSSGSQARHLLLKEKACARSFDPCEEPSIALVGRGLAPAVAEFPK